MFQSVDVPWTQGMNFGMGVNLLNGQIAGKAVDPGPVTTTVSAAGQTVTYQLKIVTSLEEIYNSLGISVEASGHYGLFSASGKVKYANEAKFNTQSTFLVAHCFVENAFEQCEGAMLTDAAKPLLKAGQTTRFQDRFGDGFVRGMQNGGEFHSIISIVSSTSAEQKSLALSLQAKYEGILAGGGVDASLDQETKKRLEKSDLGISTYQRGGHGDETSLTKDIELVMSRLKAFPAFILANPVPFGVQIASYQTLDLPDGPNPIDIQAQKEALTDYARTMLRIDSLRNDVEFMQLNPTLYKKPPDVAVLNRWSDFFASERSEVVTQASRCANNPVGGCPSFSFKLPDDFSIPERTAGIAGVWRLNLDGGGFSQWTLTPRGGNQYDAVEEGLGNARGIAVLEGTVSSMTFAATVDATTGRYTWAFDDSFTSATVTLEFFTVHTGILHGRLIKTA